MTEFITLGQAIALIVLTGVLVSIVVIFKFTKQKKEGSENGRKLLELGTKQADITKLVEKTKRDLNGY
jgi:cbb3-type cytochrome oxidase subunit 3